MKSLELLAEKTAELITDLDSLEKFDVSSFDESKRNTFYGKLGKEYIRHFSDGCCSADKKQLDNYVALGCAALLKTENPREYGADFSSLMDAFHVSFDVDTSNLNALLSTICAYDYKVRSKEPDDFFAAAKVLEGATSYFKQHNNDWYPPKVLRQIVKDTHNNVHNYFWPKIRKDEYYIHWDSKFNISKTAMEQFTNIAKVYSNEIYLSRANTDFMTLKYDAEKGLQACCYLLLHEISYVKPGEHREKFEQIIDWLNQSRVMNYKDLHSNFSKEWLLVIEGEIKKEFKSVFDKRWLEEEPIKAIERRYKPNDKNRKIDEEKYRLYEKLKPYLPGEMKKIQRQKNISDGIDNLGNKWYHFKEKLPRKETVLGNLVGGGIILMGIGSIFYSEIDTLESKIVGGTFITMGAGLKALVTYYWLDEIGAI